MSGLGSTWRSVLDSVLPSGTLGSIGQYQFTEKVILRVGPQACNQASPVVVQVLLDPRALDRCRQQWMACLRKPRNIT